MSSRLGVIGLYQRIFATYRTEAPRLLPIAALVFIPLGVVEALGDRLIDIDPDAATDLELLGALFAALAQTGTALLGEVFYSGAVAAVIVGLRAGTYPSLGGIARRLPYRRLLVVDILFNVGLVIAFLLLVIPSGVFLAYFALTAPVVEIEERGVRAAFRRSAELVRGRFWTVLAVVLPVAVGVELVSEAAGSATEALLGHSLVADWVGTTAGDIVATPVYAVAAVVLTLELIAACGSAKSTPAK